tara:strand:+ start:739 stop:1131 length:393 start_codon:yes stop_codon:yes gene_type:complete
MGLDQYAYKVKRKYAPTTKTSTVRTTEFFYWRKHNALHGWMENLYNGKKLEDGINIDSDDFNGVAVKLEEKDLDKLEQDVMTFNLPQTAGFFFGRDSVGDEYQKEQTLEFLKKARKALAEGYEVEYNSWW